LFYSIFNFIFCQHVNNIIFIKNKCQPVNSVKNISPYTLRHSFCTNMLLVKNKSLKAVSNYVGHSSTSITADMYCHDQLKVEDVF